MRLEIKPISVNQAWQGRRFKTDKYKSFERDMLLIMPNNFKVIGERLSITISYGFSSKLSDIDNPCKMVLDCLCKKYGFDDRQIFELIQTKEIVNKGKEFIDIKVKELN